jgi:hypothetical protein
MLVLVYTPSICVGICAPRNGPVSLAVSFWGDLVEDAFWKSAPATPAAGGDEADDSSEVTHTHTREG